MNKADSKYSVPTCSIFFYIHCLSYHFYQKLHFSSCHVRLQQISIYIFFAVVNLNSQQTNRTVYMFIKYVVSLIKTAAL